MKNDHLTFYNYFHSSASYRVRVALHLKGLAFESKAIHLLNDGGQQHSAEYRTMNPIGAVPTLIHHDKIISQSTAIIEYLDEVFPQTQTLLSGDAYQRAKIRQVCENINADIQPLQNLKVMQYLEKKHQYTQEQKNEWAAIWIEKGFSATEKMLEKTAKDFCFGDSMTAADLFLIPQIFAAKRFKVDISTYKILSRINENCLTHPAFMKSHPYRQLDTPAELKIN